MPNDTKMHLDMLLQSIQLLAASYDVQTKVLPEFVHVPDEVALIFDEAYLFVDDLTKEGLITTLQKKDLEQIDILLSKMSEDEHLWTLYSLKNSTRWDTLRLSAKSILTSFHQAEQLPHLFWVQYITKKNPPS